MNKKTRFSVSYFISVLTIFLAIQWLFFPPTRNIREIKYSIIKLAAHDEESKNEEENKHSKRYNEDICYTDVGENSAAQVTVRPASTLIHQKPYFGFTDRPSTPPPDLL